MCVELKGQRMTLKQCAVPASKECVMHSILITHSTGILYPIRSNTGSWRWQYNLQCTLQDCPATGLDSSIEEKGTIQATLTPTAAEVCDCFY